MTAPLIRVRRRRDLGLTDLVNNITQLAPEIELGWNHLLDELRDAGWPTRTPEHDRHPHKPRDPNQPPPEPNSLNYADPTGLLATTSYTAKTGDLEALQDHLNVVNHSLQALHLIAKRHRPPATQATPGCIIPNCNQPVESRTLPGGQHTYIGMEQIAGHWVAKHGTQPMCSQHRARRQRRIA